MWADLATAVGIHCGVMAVLGGVTYYLCWDQR